MKLYDSRRAPNPRRVRWLMAEKGVEDLEVVDVDILKGEHRTDEYMGRTGIANVPSLTLDDGTTITESIAICRYLESRYPEPNLFGRDPEETAKFEMWLRRSEMMAATPLMMAVRHTHPALAAIGTQVPAIAESNRASAERVLRFFDKRLGEAEWIAGERISMADGVLFIGMEFARMIRFRPDESLTNVLRWQEAMRARPSAAAGA